MQTTRPKKQTQGTDQRAAEQRILSTANKLSESVSHELYSETQSEDIWAAHIVQLICIISQKLPLRLFHAIFFDQS